MFHKTECDFELLDFVSWIYHHYMSGDGTREHEQINLAIGIYAAKGPTTVRERMEAWDTIETAMLGLPWPVHPEKVTKEELETQGATYLIHHFYTSGEGVVERAWQRVATEMICKHGESIETWLLIVKECENVENEWKQRLQNDSSRCCRASGAHSTA